MSRRFVAVALLAGALFAAPVSEGARAVPAGAAGLLPGDIDEDIAELEKRQTGLKQQSAERHALLVARGRSYVRLVRAGLMPLSQGMEAMAGHASRLERLRRSLARDLARLRAIDAERTEVARRLQGLSEILPSDKREWARARDAIVAAQEREQAFRQAFTDAPREAVAPPRRASGAEPEPPAASAVYGARDVLPSEQGGSSFARRRGRLPFPVAGRTELKRTSSASGVGSALEVSASAGASVRAIHTGRVAFADEYPDLGKTVIIDHGEGYYSVSSGLDRIEVEVGEELDAGETLGRLGVAGTRGTLKFEIRAGQGAVNTAEWLGI